MKLRVLFFLLFSSALTNAFSQCTTITASVPSSLCLNESGLISNTTTAASFEWDFCPENLKQVPTANLSAYLSNFTTPVDLKVAKDGSNWFGLVLDLSNRITRIEFGNSLDNTPAFTEFGNIGNALSSPSGMDVVKEGANWYGVVVNSNSSQLVLLSFGASLANTPTTSILFSALAGSDPFSVVRLVPLAGGGHLVFVTEFSSRNIKIIPFSNGLNQAPDPVIDVGFPSTAPIDLQVMENCGQWSVFVVGFYTKTIYRLDFGNSFANTPTVNPLNSFSFYPYRIWSGREGDEFYCVVTNADTGGLYKMELGNNLQNNSPSGTDLGNFGVLATSYSLSMVNDAGKWSAFMVNGTNNPPLYRLSFPDNCGSNSSFSTAAVPNAIAFSSPGSKKVALTAFQTSNTTSASFSINVQNLQPPDIDFSFQNHCVNNNVNFSTVSLAGGIANYAWDFGDGGTSASANPTYVYGSASSFDVTLNITSTNGCHNLVQKPIQIFNPPQAGFSLPAANPFCTNQNYAFTNTSTYDASSNPNWQWNVNGTNVTTAQDLNYLFTSSAAESITLTASIPGCSTQSTQNITSVVQGPLVSFNSPPTSCVGNSISFTNTTTDPFSSVLWAFGDGHSSSLSNSTNNYSTSGIYPVVLTATNAAGCQNSLSKNIAIYSNPQPNFSIEAPPLSCERSPAQFDNLTPPLSDSNITSWLWSFADAAGGSSIQKNPAYTYSSAGSYNVTLQATSNFGCSKSVQKNTTIFPSPRASFAYPRACVNQSTVFTSTSQGSIAALQWNIENNLSTGSSASHTYASSGSFPTSLTVTSVNGCVSQKDSIVSVPVKPTLDFSVQAPCTLHPTTFRETSALGPDPAVAWNWSFGGTGLTADFQFLVTGIYPVTMTSTRQSGCIYSFSKNITIYDGPVASFTPSVFAGAVPLTVTFVNNSPADTNLWNFGDHVATKVEAVSPSFTYSALGAYKVLLTTKNNKGCSDTTSTQIDVVIPHVDVVMNSFSLTNDPNSNTSKPVIGLLNSGNIPLINPEILIDLGGGVLLKAKIPGLVKPGKSILETLDLQIVPQAIQYVCAEIDIADDVNSSNNKQCISLTNEDVLMSPYPNPSGTGQVTLQWVGAVQENVRITVYRSNGDIAFAQNLDAVQSGLGQLTINTSSFANGLYLIQFAGSKMSKTFRLLIAN